MLTSLKNRVKSISIEYIKRLNLHHRIDHISMHDNIRLNSYKKEPDTVKWVKSLSPKDVFYDIGSNIGAYCLIAPCKTIAIEPAVWAYTTLIKNIHTNKMWDKITPINIALGNTNCVTEMAYNNDRLYSGSWGITQNSIFKLSQIKHKHPILQLTLDELILKTKLPLPTHILIDVDGAEYDVLQGMIHTLVEVKSIMIEYQDGDKNVTHILEHSGFKLVDKYDVGANELNIYNFLWSRE